MSDEPVWDDYNPTDTSTMQIQEFWNNKNLAGGTILNSQLTVNSPQLTEPMQINIRLDKIIGTLVNTGHYIKFK